MEQEVNIHELQLLGRVHSILHSELIMSGIRITGTFEEYS